MALGSVATGGTTTGMGYMIRHSSRNLLYLDKVKKKKPKEDRNRDRREETNKGKLIKTERKKGVNNVKYAYVRNTRKDNEPNSH